jgi:hypothetical protein
LWFVIGGVALLAAACGGAATGSDSDGGDSTGSSIDVEGAPLVLGWNTDWTNRTIELSELVKGRREADPRDLIVPIDEPTFETVDEAAQWLEIREPVGLVQFKDEVRVYPLRILTWHEVVNDQVGGVPIAVTYCPLCNSAVAFERTVNDQVLRFGTSGLLRNSDLVMWDRQTESLWQQITGEGIVGELAGTQLEFVPIGIVAWDDVLARFPDAQVLSRDTGFNAPYGQNPYFGYDQGQLGTFLFDGEVDDRFPAFERVVGVRVGETTKAYPFSALSEKQVANDVVAGEPVLVVWGADDTASALDDSVISKGRSVGTGLAYLRTLDERVLTFEAGEDDTFIDAETGTTWDLLGRAQGGPLEGQQLAPAIHTNELWFAWAAFNPDAVVYGGEADAVA